MGHDGASALRHLHCASHPLPQCALAGKRAMRTPSPVVIHLTLGEMAEPCPVDKNLCKLVPFRWSLVNYSYIAVVGSSEFPSCICVHLTWQRDKSFQKISILNQTVTCSNYFGVFRFSVMSHTFLGACFPVSPSWDCSRAHPPSPSVYFFPHVPDTVQHFRYSGYVIQTAIPSWCWC